MCVCLYLFSSTYRLPIIIHRVLFVCLFDLLIHIINVCVCVCLFVCYYFCSFSFSFYRTETLVRSSADSHTLRIHVAQSVCMRVCVRVCVRANYGELKTTHPVVHIHTHTKLPRSFKFKYATLHIVLLYSFYNFFLFARKCLFSLPVATSFANVSIH